MEQKLIVLRAVPVEGVSGPEMMVANASPEVTRIRLRDEIIADLEDLDDDNLTYVIGVAMGIRERRMYATGTGDSTLD